MTLAVCDKPGHEGMPVIECEGIWPARRPRWRRIGETLGVLTIKLMIVTYAVPPDRQVNWHHANKRPGGLRP